MATDITPKEISVLIDGKTYTVNGAVVAVILYLTNHSAFFNDPRTTGNFLLMCKEGKQSTKNEMTLNP
jgi:hypothetical protein